MRDSRCGAKSTMQSMPDVFSSWHCLLHVRALLAKWYNRKQEVHFIRAGSPLYPELLHQEGPATRSQVREERRLQRIPHGKSTSKKCRKREYKNIHDRFIRDTWFRKTMIELGHSEEVILEMDRLANEDHTHIATEEIDVYRGNWWIRSNLVDSDAMPTRRQPDFKKALSTLYRLKKTEDKAYYENWSQSSSSWWQWQTSWWHPSFETSPRRWTWHWSNRETKVVSETSIYVWHESHKEFGAKLQWSFR